MHSKRWKAVRPARMLLALMVVGVHLWASWWLLFRFHLPAPRLDGEGHVLLVRFIPRRVESPTPSSVLPAPHPAPVARTAAPIEAANRTRESRHVDTSAEFVPASNQGARRPLDLSVPDDFAPIGFGRPDPMASRAAVEPRTTRFEARWATDGDAVEKLKEDSVVARTLLGLFGGRDSCTEKAIRERRADCVGADYRPDLHEAMQGH